MALLCRLHGVTRAKRSWAGSLASSCLSDPTLWDRLYAQALPGSSRNFDWFFGYEEVQGLILPLLQKGTPQKPAVAPIRVLDVGCGTSGLCSGLYTKCPLPLNVLGVDFSPVAVSHMKHMLEGHGESPRLSPRHPASRLHFLQADARNLGSVCASGSFELVLDKGTWDAVARGGLARAEELLSECLRVLAPQGTLVQFSDEDPDVRLPCLEQGAGSRLVTVHELGPFKGLCYFAYIVQAAQ
ncbi:citrate synthase-lysine N-methyltransferase CSKMT, mitochondrial isoform X2 [Petaurus breviceps papuanus]|uniref:citrate synthase-lysine N-methyltransferase CSKMT, mitochondrial isoform X2 n=1 Tax=Petaurus breviceps papuanus TaxID=3040969 RepID=UPI0036DEAA3F